MNTTSVVNVAFTSGDLAVLPLAFILMVISCIGYALCTGTRFEMQKAYETEVSVRQKDEHRLVLLHIALAELELEIKHRSRPELK